MIIQIIDIYRVSALEPERHPPIARDRYRKMAFPGAFERVQSKAGQVHSFCSATPVQHGQNTRQLGGVFRRDFRRAPAFIKRLQAAMAERFDHSFIVWCQSTVVNNVDLKCSGAMRAGGGAGVGSPMGSGPSPNQPRRPPLG